jgi:hypothetical protein
MRYFTFSLFALILTLLLRNEFCSVISATEVCWMFAWSFRSVLIMLSGWHMDCLQPPLSESPPGKWHCPICPPLDENGMLYSEPMHPTEELRPRDSSVASSSRSIPRYKNKGKGRAIFTDESEVDLDVQEVPSAIKIRARQRHGRKGKARAIPDEDEDEYDESPVRPPSKKVKMRIRSPSPPSRPRVVVRLRLPGRGKGKEREEEERKGMFDDILGVEERDTSKTNVVWGDKQRFERSRLLADVRSSLPSESFTLT